MGTVAKLAALTVAPCRHSAAIRVVPAVLARTEADIPNPADRRESVIAALVPLVVPVVMVGHLRTRQPLLQRVGNVEAARHTAVLLEALQYAKQVRKPERLSVQWDQNLREDVADDRVAEIVGPVIFVGVARERVLRPVMDRVDLLPQVPAPYNIYVTFVCRTCMYTCLYMYIIRSRYGTSCRARWLQYIPNDIT